MWREQKLLLSRQRQTSLESAGCPKESPLGYLLRASCSRGLEHEPDFSDLKHAHRISWIRTCHFLFTYCTLTAKEVEDNGYCHNTKIQNIIRHFWLLGTPEHDILALECEMLILKSLI
ncbi:hypothetical protein ACS0TY_023997 [Phlomoides rotata]